MAVVARLFFCPVPCAEADYLESEIAGIPNGLPRWALRIWMCAEPAQFLEVVYFFAQVPETKRAFLSFFKLLGELLEASFVGLPLAWKMKSEISLDSLKHRVGNPGGNTELFVQLARGLYSLK